MKISNRSSKNLRTLACIVVFASVSGGVFSYLTAFRTVEAFLQGMIDGFLVSLLLESYTIFIVKYDLSDLFQKFSFTLTVLINSVVYVVPIIGGRFIGQFLLEPDIETSRNTFFVHFY